jgi:hypothetical protein
MITFEQFENLMKPLFNYREEYNQATKALETLSDDSFVTPRLGARLFDGYISLLSFIMDDEDEDIEYFIHECECGNKPMEVSYKDGTKFNLDSVKTLYDCILYGIEFNKKATGN